MSPSGRVFGDPLVAMLKFVPTARDHDSFFLPRVTPRTGDELPLPPDDLLVGYADSAESYERSGVLHVQVMRDALAATGLPLASANGILDFGCGIGRMTRALRAEAERTAVWGVDISARHIHWLQAHLSPPFHFATTTTLPHLPFPDGTFDVVFAGSVFTHIEDLTHAWLLELRRILRREGRAYVTLHDESTLAMLAPGGVFETHWLGDQVRTSPAYQACGGEFGMLVIGRDSASQVFYHSTFFRHLASSTFDVLACHPGVHGYQTAYVLKPRG